MPPRRFMADAIEKERPKITAAVAAAINRLSLSGMRREPRSKFLTFEPAGKSPSGKTRRWIVNTRSGPLGEVRWHAPWRRYVYEVRSAGTIFDEQCLRDLAAFCEFQTGEHRAGRG